MDTNYSEKGFLFGFRLIYPKQLPLWLSSNLFHLPRFRFISIEKQEWKDAAKATNNFHQSTTPRVESGFRTHMHSA